MNYKSTRGGKLQSSTFATLHGLANGGGLYIPEKLPEVKLTYDELKNLSYQELSEKIIILLLILMRCCHIIKYLKMEQ